MSSTKDIFIHCDELENLPKQNRDNYLYEITLLKKELPQNAHVLQVGSMDGMRIIRLLEVRPDLQITGLDIEEALVDLAKENVAKAGVPANFVLGDITNPPDTLSHYDYVLCLNNTLGYIPNQEKAIEEMKKLGNTVIISVYGEPFDDTLAYEYFKALNLELESIEHNQCILKDFSIVKRYTKEDVATWGSKILEAPIGYFCILN